MARTKRIQVVQEATIIEKWILFAFAGAMLLHLLAAISFGWIHVPSLALPTERAMAQSPLMVHVVHVRSDAMESQPASPMDNPPAGIHNNTTAPIDLDPRWLEKMRQKPDPRLLTPSLQNPNQIIASAPLVKGLPLGESENSSLTTQIEHVQTGPLVASPVSPSILADQTPLANIGPLKEGDPVGSRSGGSGAGDIPGFSQVVRSFKPPAVETNNVVEPAVIRLPADVLFNFNEAVLLPEATPLLQKAANFITKYPQASVNVDGYTDSIGTPSYNLTLSEQRAQAVENWLSANVPPGQYRFHSLGHGASDFVVDPNGNKDQQQENRRVELLVQALKQ